MSDEPGTIRPVSGEIVPQAHGGALRHGGGRPKDSGQVLRIKEILRSGAEETARAVVAKAKKGDLRAAQMVLEYAIGKPTDRVELSGPDGGPIELAATMTDEERRVLRDAIREHLANKAAREVS